MEWSLVKAAVNCTNCRTCLLGIPNFPEQDPEYTTEVVCPTFASNHIFTTSPAGKVKIAASLAQGFVDYSPELLDAFYMDPLCYACVKMCSFNVRSEDVLNQVEIFRAVRAEFVKRGIILPLAKQVADHLEKEHNPLFQPHTTRTAWLRTKVKDKGDVLYFVGCTESYFPQLQETPQAIVKIFERAGVSFCMLKQDEHCCGLPLVDIGMVDKAKELMEYNVKAITKTGAKEVVFSCPHCYKTFSKDYPRYYGRLPFKVSHVTQFVSQLLSAGKLPLKRSVDLELAYHDPCNLTRYMGEYEAPRAILSKIPGLKVQEMKMRREVTFCCGGGGACIFLYPDFALNTAKLRLNQAKAMGVEGVVTSCPHCEINFINTNMMRVLDVIQLVDRALE